MKYPRRACAKLSSSVLFPDESVTFTYEVEEVYTQAGSSSLGNRGQPRGAPLVQDTRSPGTSTSLKTPSLVRDQLFVEFVKKQLFSADDPLLAPSNDEIVDAARVAGFPISSPTENGNGYTPGSAKKFVKDIKQETLQVLCQHTTRLFDELRAECFRFEKAIRLLKDPIDQGGMKGSQEARRNEIVRAVRCKLTWGLSEQFLMSGEALARKLAEAIAADIGLAPQTAELQMGRLVQYGTRHLLMSIWGAEDSLFNVRRPTPLLLNEVREELARLRPIPPNSGVSSTQVITSLPGLYQMLRKILKSDDVTLAAQIIVNAADVSLTMSSPKKNWESVAVRRQFYIELVKDAAQHPNDVSLGTVHNHAPGLKTYYSVNGTPLSTRETLLELFNEFHPGGRSQLIRDQIMGCGTAGGKEWLALRYYDPSRPPSHYSEVFGYKNASATRLLITRLGRKLAERFRSGESTRSIADSLNVGRRGLGEIRASFSSHGAERCERVPFYQKGASAANTLDGLNPKRTCLTYTDLAEELCSDRVARILSGRFDSRRIAEDKVTYSKPTLVELRNLIAELRTTLSKVNETAVWHTVERIRDTLTALLMGSPHVVSFPPQRKLGAISYTLADSDFCKLRDLADEIAAELTYPS